METNRNQQSHNKINNLMSQKWHSEMVFYSSDAATVVPQKEQRLSAVEGKGTTHCPGDGIGIMEAPDDLSV